MKKELKVVVQEHLNNKILSSSQLNNLLALQQKNTQEKQSHFIEKYRRHSVVAVLIFSMLTVYFVTPTLYTVQPIEQKIANEVASNHLKLKPLEIKANTLQGISHYFKQLSFLPVNPISFKLPKQHLMGARYCSIQGVRALQLRMKDSRTNNLQTLYETEYDKKVFKGFPDTGQGNQPVTVYVKGMKVDMWVEKDILFALIE